MINLKALAAGFALAQQIRQERGEAKASLKAAIGGMLDCGTPQVAITSCTRSSQNPSSPRSPREKRFFPGGLSVLRFFQTASKVLLQRSSSRFTPCSMQTPE